MSKDIKQYGDASFKLLQRVIPFGEVSTCPYRGFSPFTFSSGEICRKLPIFGMKF